MTQYEHLLLETVKFAFDVVHPHEELVQLISLLDGTLDFELILLVTSVGTQKDAFAFVQQCYHVAEVILIYPPVIIAMAALFYAQKIRRKKDIARELAFAASLGIKLDDLTGTVRH